ncbi:hypothetical protein [Labedella endophytica]|nr:hypothetical protein [Labedella endophytica]
MARAGAIALVCGVLLAGCADAGDGAGAGATGGASGTSILESLEDVAELPGVESVDDYSSELVVRIAADATDEQVLDVGAAVNAAATREGRTGRVMLNRVGEAFPTETDMIPLDPWSVDVLPVDPEEVERRLTGALEVESLDLGASLYVSSHWPSATIDPAVDFGDAFARIAATDLFADGGTYTSGSGEHLTIVHVAKRTTVEAVKTIIAIAADYPTVEFLLQATEEGPQWPHLLVAGLDAQQGAALDARLREPDLADADPEGFAQQFQLTVTGADGPTYIAGTLGDVPR